MKNIYWFGIVLVLICLVPPTYAEAQQSTQREVSSDSLSQGTSSHLTEALLAPPHQSEDASTPELTTDDVTDWLDGYIPYALADGDIAGAVVTVVQDDTIVANRGYGFADLAQREPVDSETTLFRIASISKLFTATAVMQLVEQGQLDLDQNVNAYLDFELPMPLGEITLEHLLTHTPGFEEVLRGLILADADEPATLRDYLVNNIPSQVFPPGEVPAYSNYGSALAGYIVERVSGEAFEDYIDQHIFAPLGMDYSTFRQPLPEELAPYMSHGYRSLSDGHPQPFEIVSGAPAGSLSASGVDMAQFMIAHLNEGAGLLQPETTRLMHEYEMPNAEVQQLNNMVLGFRQQERKGLNIIGHGGTTFLFRSELFLVPEKNVGVFISMNSPGIGTSNVMIREHLLDAFMDRYFPVEEAPPVPLPTAYEHGQVVAGTYEVSHRSATNAIAALAIMTQYQVSVSDEGTLHLTSPSPRGFFGFNETWEEVEPWVWRPRGDTEELVVNVVDGQVQALTKKPSAMIATPVPWWRSSVVLGNALQNAVLIFAVSALAWPIRAVARWRFGVAFPFKGAQAIAYLMARIASLAVLTYIVGWIIYFIWAVPSNFDEASLWLLQLLYGAAILPVASVCMMVWVNFVVWRESAGWFAKLSAALIMVSVLVTIWFAAVGGLFSFDVTY
ncbi:MAG: serine hydrolase domain-containing protein [Chloroflexota bacterium]